MKTSSKFLAEMLGTFLLVFGGCGTAIFAGAYVGFLGVALAFGLTVLAMVYTIGPISGAHLNPAVSFGLYFNHRLSMRDMLWYWLAQIIGGIIAATILYVISINSGINIGTFAANGYGSDFFYNSPNYLHTNTLGAFLIEAILTFIFLIVILGSTDKKAPKGFAGIAIGLTLTLIHLISIPLTNTSVNPARSISQALFSDNVLALPQLWLFIIAPLIGAGLAGILYKYISQNKA